jgi:hypothetical protein
MMRTHPRQLSSNPQMIGRPPAAFASGYKERYFWLQAKAPLKSASVNTLWAICPRPDTAVPVMRKIVNRLDLLPSVLPSVPAAAARLRACLGAVSILLALIAIAAPAGAEAVFPPGSRVGLAPPGDMAPSRTFSGFEARS